MQPRKTPNFYVGAIPIYGKTILAPMDGYSDQPFRGLARLLGSAMSYTEFVNSKDVLNTSKDVSQRLQYEEAERPVVFQLYDDDPARILQAAEQLMSQEPDIIDINMGCSESKISGRGAGAGLLRTPKKVAQIIRQLSDALDIPVTAKIRLGWDDESLNYLEIAKIIEDNGGQLVAVHGRTKEQAYRGQANWDAIAEIKQAVSIPVIGNGDVKSPQDIEDMIAHTGCDAVMIGRAAIGNPWIFEGLSREEVHPAKVRETMLLHLDRMVDFYGPERGVILFRKHVQRYISPHPLPKDQRTKLLTCGTADAFISFLDQFYFDVFLSKEDVNETKV